jgi:predicted nucleic acid-binding Zn ribbon protein
VQSITHALPGALTELLRDTPLSDGKVTFAWTSAVGPALARATHVKLEQGVLIVETSSVQWAREIRRSAHVILPRLASLLGAGVVSSIEIRR